MYGLPSQSENYLYLFYKYHCENDYYNCVNIFTSILYSKIDLAVYGHLINSHCYKGVMHERIFYF